MIVIACPDCDADFAVDDVGDECPECGGNLTNGSIVTLDFVIQCPGCEGRIGIQNIDPDDRCPECGDELGFAGKDSDQ